MAKITAPSTAQQATRAVIRERSTRGRRGGIDATSTPLTKTLVQSEPALAQMVESLREHLGRTGLDQGETQQVGARLPASLVREAKKRTGLVSNTDLLTFALANVAIADNFADAFENAHGKLDPDLDVGF